MKHLEYLPGVSLQATRDSACSWYACVDLAAWLAGPNSRGAEPSRGIAIGYCGSAGKPLMQLENVTFSGNSSVGLFQGVDVTDSKGSIQVGAHAKCCGAGVLLHHCTTYHYC